MPKDVQKQLAENTSVRMQRSAAAGPEFTASAHLKRLREITTDIRATMGENLPSSDHGWLYDSKSGLPE